MKRKFRNTEFRKNCFFFFLSYHAEMDLALGPLKVNLGSNLWVFVEVSTAVEYSDGPQKFFVNQTR